MRNRAPACRMAWSGVSRTALVSKTRGLETRNPAPRKSRRAAPALGTASLISFSRSPDLRPFIGEFVYGADTVSQGFKQGASPTGGRIRYRLLVGLLVGGGVEQHGRIGGCDELLDGDQELDIASGLLLFHGEVRKLREFLGGMRLGKG